MKRIFYILTPVIIFILLLGGYVYFSHTTEKTIKIFSAGSLSIPLQNLGEYYEKEYGVKIDVEPSGSLEAIRKIIDLGKSADIVAVADYRLLGDLMYPRYIDWYVAFASNEIVVVFTNSSKYHSDMENNPDKWVDILLKNDVKFGFSNPNKDPCGYRALGVIALESIKLNNYTIFGNLVSNLSNISYNLTSNGVEIYVPADIKIHSDKLVIRSKSIDLISLVEAGSIDYAFEYKSVAVQHKLNYIELPEDINLKDPSYDGFYSRVSVTLLAGSEKEYSVTIKSIVYGLAVLKDSKNHREAINFVKLLLSNEGREIFNKLGQEFLSKPIFYGSPPSELLK